MNLFPQLHKVSNDDLPKQKTKIPKENRKFNYKKT